MTILSIWWQNKVAQKWQFVLKRRQYITIKVTTMPFDRKEYDKNRDKTAIKCHICGGSYVKRNKDRHAQAQKHIKAYDLWMKGLHSMVDEE